MAREIATSIANDVGLAETPGIIGSAPAPLPATVFGRSARRYAHLSVIDGGRPR